MSTANQRPRAPRVPFRTLCVFLLFGAAASCGVGPNDESSVVETQRSAAVTGAPMNIYVPAYYPSSDTQSWNDFLTGLPTSTSSDTTIYVIVNGQHSEPDATFDATLASHIASIQAKGHMVLGYVDWMQKTGPCNSSLRDCSGRWNQLAVPCVGACIMNYTIDNITRWGLPDPNTGSSYGVNGVFVDDAQRNDISELSQAELITWVAQRQMNIPYVLFNWGTYAPSNSLLTHVDCGIRNAWWRTALRWVDYEGDVVNLHNQPQSNFSWSFPYLPTHFVQIGYNYQTAPDWTTIDESVGTTYNPNVVTLPQRNAGGFFMTDKNGSSPGGAWGTPPRADLFSRLVSDTGTQFSYSGGGNNGLDNFQCPGNAGCSSSCLTCSCPGRSSTMAGTILDQHWYFQGSDWDWGYYKGTCPAGWGQLGLSDSMPAGSPGHAILCRELGTSIFTGAAAATVAGPYDNRRYGRNGDWDQGYWKLECGANEYVSGSSEATSGGSNQFHAIQCSTGGTNHLSVSGCYTRTFEWGDDRSTTDSGDWDVNYFKGECGTTEYVAGVSIDPSYGKPHSLLCCPTM